MRRREFIAGLGSAVAWPVVARAQQTERVRRIGVLMSQAADNPQAQARIAAFLQALQRLGWTEGRNIRIDTRWGPPAPNDVQVRNNAAELVALAPDVILASASRPTAALGHMFVDYAGTTLGAQSANSLHCSIIPAFEGIADMAEAAPIWWPCELLYCPPLPVAAGP